MITIKDLSKLKHYNRTAICSVKHRYDLIDTAYEAVSQLMNSDICDGNDFTIYRCPVCKYWHYGRQNKNKVVK